MGPDPTLTEAAVRDLSRPQSYDRGTNYHDEGAVVDIVQRGETIRAAVEGSQYEPYEVRIDLDETGVVDTRCSCPYDHGGICKHRVAVLLAYVRDPDEIKQRPPVRELIVDANPEDLREILIDLGENHPKVAEHIESRLGAKGTENESLNGANTAELAEWLRNRASSMGEQDVALEAAVITFTASPSLPAYQAAENLAGEDWPTVRKELLESLADRDTNQRTARRHIEIFVYAERYGEAIDIADRFSDYKTVEPVVEAVWADRPQWTIDACKEQAEPIIEEGQSQRYRHAVDWLETAGNAAEAAGDLDEWRDYVEGLRDEHYQKYKLRPMLEELLEEFDGRSHNEDHA
jgi:uncharacterized Zn finger protein